MANCELVAPKRRGVKTHIRSKGPHNQNPTGLGRVRSGAERAGAGRSGLLRPAPVRSGSLRPAPLWTVERAESRRWSGVWGFGYVGPEVYARQLQLPLVL